jgi:hypothetical protein
MAILFLDSFDHYATDDLLMKWDASTDLTAFTIVNTTPRRSGSYYLKAQRNVTNNITYLQKNIVSTPIDTIIIGFGSYCSILPLTIPTSGLIGFYNSAEQLQFTVAILPNGSVAGYRGATNSGNLVGATPAGIISPATWQYIETKFTVAESPNGVFVVQVNGIEQYSISGVDTRGGTTAGVTHLRYYTQSTTASVFHAMDDLYILNNTPPNGDFLGDCRIDCLYPTADGTHHDFIPYNPPDNLLTNYECVDDANNINLETDYVEGSVVGDKDTYEISDMPLLDSVYGVAATICARKTDSGNRTIRGMVHIAGSEYFSSSIGIADTYDVYQRYWDVNPNGGGSWTYAVINAMEAGVEIES